MHDALLVTEFSLQASPGPSRTRRRYKRSRKLYKQNPRMKFQFCFFNHDGHIYRRSICSDTNIPRYCSWNVQKHMVTFEKVNHKYRDLTKMAFKSRSVVIEQMEKTEATSRTYDQISKRAKKGTYNSDVINSIMANQTASSTAFLNEAEKTRVQEMYQMVNSKQGNIKFNAFWEATT